MAKYSRKTVGSIVKSKEEGKPDYIKLRGDTSEALIKALLKVQDPKKGLMLNLESKKFQMDSLNSAIEAGKLKGEGATKAMERVTNIPDWVRFEIVLVEKND